ncbi:hypothetical protein [Robinsoniella sp. KNHs210]|uniref:hypothetical protein n=1 Tax=Robinsoniella sp. KNHs210 TaxID=1469950 RepID=UPI000484478D|nr:hypothetical protein [Robinsoniella sp. KNHs210]
MSKWKQIESGDVINHLARGNKVRCVVISDSSALYTGVYELNDRAVGGILEMIREGFNLFFEEEKELKK